MIDHTEPGFSVPDGATTLARRTQSAAARYARFLETFSPVSLAEMQDASLLRRVSSKYIMTTRHLLCALDDLSEDYDALEIQGRRMHHYRTRYFDTPSLACYLQHHNGWRSRYKVRSRTYLDTDETYLEVKRKDSCGITTKHRMQMQSGAVRLEHQARDFVSRHCPLPAYILTPTVWNTFWRGTLVSTDTVERVTLDVGLTLGCGDDHVALPDIVVAEVKQEHPSMCSRFVDQMRALGLRPMRFSKYCVGVTCFYPTVKRNHFKPTLLRLDALLEEKGVYGEPR